MFALKKGQKIFSVEKRERERENEDVKYKKCKQREQTDEVQIFTVRTFQNASIQRIIKARETKRMRINV